MMVASCPALLALVFGWLAFRSRVTGVYLSIITQALSYALMLAFFRNDMGFGGNNGFTDFKDIARASTCSATRTRVGPARGDAPRRWPQATWLCRLIVDSRAGRVIRAIRDAESRTRFLGYRVESYKLWLFVVSAIIAGVAGALYVPQVGIINPSEFAPINSIEVGHLGRRRRPRHARTARRPAPSSSTTRRRTSPARCPRCGCTRSARLFVLVTLFLPRGAASDCWPAAAESAKMTRCATGRSSISKNSPSASTASRRSTT